MEINCSHGKLELTYWFCQLIWKLISVEHWHPSLGQVSFRLLPMHSRYLVKTGISPPSHHPSPTLKKKNPYLCPCAYNNPFASLHRDQDFSGIHGTYKASCSFTCCHTQKSFQCVPAMLYVFYISLFLLPHISNMRPLSLKRMSITAQIWYWQRWGPFINKETDW